MKIKQFQQGGEVAPQAAPQQGNPEQQVIQMAQEIVGQLGIEAAIMLANAIMQIAQQSQQAPPTYQRKGGKLVLKGKKA